MKSIIATIFLACAVLMNSNAATVETLTSTNEVYRASVSPGYVVFNIVGKTSLTKTNVEGWLMLRTNLVKSGFVLSTEETTKTPMNPKRFVMSREMYDKVEADKQEMAAVFAKHLEEQRQQAELQALLAQAERDVRRDFNTYKVESKSTYSDGSWMTRGQYQGGTVYRYSDGSWSRHESR